MQEEIEKKTIALAISGSKITGRTLAKAISVYLNHRKGKLPDLKHGRQAIRDLMKHNTALSNIEITDKNIRSFESTAKKYGIDFALKKDNSEKPPRYLVFFKGRDADVLTMAFNEYSQKILRQKENPSIRQAIRKLAEIVKSQHKDREKIKDRSIER